MKKLIFVLAIMIMSFVSLSQVKYSDYATPESDTTGLMYLLQNAGTLIICSDTIIVPPPDTIKVMYLLCNTMEYSGYGYNYETIKYYNNSVYWEYGFMIIHDYWNRQYLNEDKVRFGNNIVIWDYKIIEE